MAEENSAEENKKLLPEPENDRLVITMLIVTFFMAIMILAVVSRSAPDFADPVYSPAEEKAVAVSASFSETAESEEENVFPININTASFSELQKIPGVGPVTASMVIKFRDAQGTIVEFDEFLSVDGIGEKTVELLAEYCYIG